MKSIFPIVFLLALITTCLRGQSPVPSDPTSNPGSETGLAPLTVTRFWYPFHSTNTPQPSILLHSYGVDADGIYISGILKNNGSDPSKPGVFAALFKVALPDLKTEEIPLPKEGLSTLHNLPEVFHTLPDGLYVTTRGTDDQSARLQHYIPASQTWTVHDLPPTRDYAFFGLNNAFYLSLATLDGKPQPGQPMPQRECGVARYDGTTGNVALLASSRRRPAQNQFDDRDYYRITGLFAGPGKKPCVTTPSGTCYIPDQTGPWPEVFDGSWMDETLTILDKTLVFNITGEVTLLDPQKSAPEPLMAARAPFFRKQSTVGSPSVKEPTPWAAQAIWDAPEKEIYVGRGGIGLHGDFLFILAKPKIKGGFYQLLCYQKGMGRVPRRIPLQFKLDDEAQKVLSLHPGHMPNGWTLDEIEHPDTTPFSAELITTDQGLGFKLICAGFWFLPYSEIEAYLKSAST